MTSTAEAIREVLQQHQFQAGEGYYAGFVICSGCDNVVDPSQHLLEALLKALGLETATPKPVQEPLDPRESQIVWEAS